MTAQVSMYGDMSLVNHLSGYAIPVASATSAPPTWYPGVAWYNTSASEFYVWQGGPPGSNSYWAAPAGQNVPGSRFIALLTADPVAGGAVNISDAGFIECATSGYSRQQVDFGPATTNYPSSASNTNVLTFTMTSSMLVAVGWAALVTVSSGSTGLFLASWVLNQSYQVNVSQSIQVGVGQLILQGN
jgi:hypothetical protein